MSVSQSNWLDLVWRALGETDPAKKDALLLRAHASLQQRPPQLKAYKR
jgi:hypothetical protein